MSISAWRLSQCGTEAHPVARRLEQNVADPLGERPGGVNGEVGRLEAPGIHARGVCSYPRSGAYHAWLVHTARSSWREEPTFHCRERPVDWQVLVAGCSYDSVAGVG